MPPKCDMQLNFSHKLLLPPSYKETLAVAVFSLHMGIQGKPTGVKNACSTPTFAAYVKQGLKRHQIAQNVAGILIIPHAKTKKSFEGTVSMFLWILN